VIALIISKVVLVVIFLLATAQVSAPIDGDIQSVSEPIAGVVLMLMAGFAPYMTYKAINFMGFDMYHAMSAEQEGKAALNRPMPIPMNRAPSSQPSKVLDGGTSGGGSGGSPTPPAPATGSGPSTGTAGASSGGGGAAAGGAAGGVAAGVVVAKEAATAGVRTGKAVGGAASQQADAAHQTPTAPSGAPLPPHVADSIPAQANGKKG
jgi:hypothetical protein